MSGISCDVCLDLMPLVQDGVASEASETLVRAHVAACPRCRAIYEGTAGRTLPALNERRLARRLKWGVRGWVTALVLAGAVVCLVMLNGGEYSQLVFLLLPFLGGTVHLCWKSDWKKRLLWLDLLLAGIGAAWGYAGAMAGWRLHRAVNEFCHAFLFCGLLLVLGAVIAALFRFAFGGRKEE